MRRDWGRLRENKPIDFLGHTVVATYVDGVSAKRSHSLVKLVVRQARQKGVGTKRGLVNEGWPVRRDKLGDGLMPRYCKSGGHEDGFHVLPSWKVRLDQRLQREEVPIDEIVLAGGIADAHLAAVPQHAVAFPSCIGGSGQMMIHLRHENEVDGAAWKRQCFCRCLLECDIVGNEFLPRLTYHSHGGIYANDLGLE